MASVDFAVFSWETMTEADCMQTSHHLLTFLQHCPAVNSNISKLLLGLWSSVDQILLTTFCSNVTA